MSISQPESGSSGGLSPYVQMLLGFGKVPKWHNFLSTLLIWTITAGFIIIPSSLFHWDMSMEDGKLFPVVGLNVPLFAISISLVFVGIIGMFVLARHRYLNNNHFWLYNKYYLRVAEGGICGLILLFVIIVKLREGKMDGPTIAALCVTCTIKVVYSGLAVWSFFKVRRAKKAHEALHVDKAEKCQTEDPYVEMLFSFVSLPGWHILLSTFLILLVTAGFIIIPPSLIDLAESHGGETLFMEFVQSEPQFGICVSIFFVGFIGMFLLSRYRYLKNNHFWLYHNYYRRMVEAGIFGVISLFLTLSVVGSNNQFVQYSLGGRAVIAVLCVTCIVTALFSGLAGWSYFKMRRAMKAHETPQAERPLTEEPQSEVSHFSGSP